MNRFIWTEIFNCGALAKVLIPSYLNHHDDPIHVFGFPNDLVGLPSHELIIPVAVSQDNGQHAVSCPGLSEEYLRAGFESGHLGTARLWAYLVISRPERYLIHIDSDIIFLGDAVNDVVRALEGGAVLAGPRRMYRLNQNNRDDVRNFNDCVHTYCFGFDREQLRVRSEWGLVRQIRGQTLLGRIRNQRVLDFFDTISFKLMTRGEVAYLDSPDVGQSGESSVKSQFSRKILEVRSAVGTGCAVFNGYGESVPDTYKRYALESFSIFAFYLLDLETGISRPQPGELEEKLLKLDRKNWRLEDK